MKILIVVLDSNLGGVTSSAVNFAKELVEHGNEVYFLDMSAQILRRKLLPEAVQVVCLEGASSKWNIGLEDIRNAKGFRKLGILLLGAVKKLTIRSGLWYQMIFSRFDRYGEFDVAIAFRQCDPCYSFVINKVSAKKKIGFVHGELKYMGDISSWKRHMTKFHKIAYVSNAVREEFVAAHSELAANACTIYNMFDRNRILRMAKEEPAIVFDKSKTNIVTVARIDNAFKQIHWIPQICAKLKDQTKVPFHWYVVGNGPDYDSTVKLSEKLDVTEVLTFTGEQENPFVIMKNADFTVLTSKSEAYPMVVMESLILEKPIVVAGFATITEMMTTEKHGLIANQSIESLTDSIIKMIENRDGIRETCRDGLAAAVVTNNIAYSQFLDAIGGKQ